MSPLASRPSASVILNLPLADVRGSTQTIDLTPSATAGRIRLIDCVSLVQDDVLRLWEFASSPLEEWTFGESEPGLKYSAISYVWKGNLTVAAGDNAAARGYLVVNGAEDGDPISISVLRAACLASLREDEPGRWRMVSRAEYLWLDRLCIAQASREDKALQIAQMYRIYRCCAQCLVLPGGIGRLVPLDEETNWAGRAWTLQESLAPHMAVVLFEWTAGTGRMLGTSVFKLREVGLGSGCALARLADVVRACLDGPMVFNKCPIDMPLARMLDAAIIATGSPVDVSIFGKGRADLLALRSARLQFQNASQVSVERRCYSMVWRSALMRTSSRPVDMVLSIMGLMGVSLNPKAFSADDRLRATLALVSAILDRGGSADWLGMPANIPPCPQLSIFPQFPITDVASSARYLISGKSIPATALDDWLFSDTSWDSWEFGTGELWPWERFRGSIDGAGYFLFSRRACVITLGTISSEDQHFEWPLLRATDGSVWHFREDLDFESQGFPRTAAVPLWRFWDYTNFDDGGLASSVAALKLMIIREHVPARFDLASYFYVQDKDRSTWKSRVEQWKEYGLAVGGPEPFKG